MNRSQLRVGLVPIEISSLFHLLGGSDEPVNDAHIGDGLYLSKLDPVWIESVRTQCPRVSAREELERQKPYTHRFHYEPADPSRDFWDVTSKEQQPLLRAVSLSRLVKPTSIAYSNVWIKSTYRSNGEVKHLSEPIIGAYSVAFGLRQHQWNTITEGDAAEMAALWDPLSHFLDDQFEPTYRRIVRSLKRFELSHAIYFADLRFPIVHSALEAIVCTTHRDNMAQVTQRLPQLVPFISSQQATDIYKLCGNLKHAAEAMLQDSNEEVPLSDRDQARVDCVSLLHESVRYLLLKALKDRHFADTIANVDVLTETYPAYNNRGRLIVPKT